MDIYSYLKMLTPQERKVIAGETDVTPSYLNWLVSKQDGISQRLAYKILHSAFNESLPSDFKYTQAAYTELCREKRMQRLNDE